jgi:hypothetical protein
LSRTGIVKWTGSDVLDLETGRNPDTDRRKKVEALLGTATSKVMVGSRERERGKALESLGFGAFDSLHLACAESAGAEVFLTTDDGLRLRALREASKLSVRVENPAKWYAEVIAP